MGRNRIKNYYNVMFKIQLIFALTILLNTSWARTTTKVEPGSGTLEEAILSSQAGDVLELTGGASYMLSPNSSGFGKINHPLTIQVETGATSKAIIRLNDDASTSKRYYFFVVGDSAALTLKGLDIHGICNNEIVAASMIVFDARPDPANSRIGNFRFENCIFHDFKDYIVHGMKNDYARGLIQDSVFIDKVTVYHAKHFLQYKHVSLRHLEMTNTTVYQLNGMALKIGKIGYRCVLESPNKPYIPISDETITPTGFIDHCTLDDLGDIHGHIQVDNAFHRFTVSNCIITNQQQFDQPAVYFLDPMTDTAVVIKNTCFWNCAPPNSKIGGNQWIGYQFINTFDSDPEYRNPTDGDFTLPENSPLLTASTTGGPIGDLRWVPETVSSVSRNSNQPDGYAYPNPFKNKTDILFTIKSSRMVEVTILNINGVEICQLINENINAGEHMVSWDATNYKPGVYFCQIRAGNKIQTFRILHI